VQLLALINKLVDIFTTIKALNFQPADYVVMGGAALAARGLKETNDIDIVVSGRLLTECQARPEWHHHPRLIATEPAGLSNGEVELYPTIGGVHISFEELRKNAEIIDGIPFASLEDMITIKQTYAREKDLEDVDRIRAYQKAN
jgi:hypothetical protein